MFLAQSFEPVDSVRRQQARWICLQELVKRIAKNRLRPGIILIKYWFSITDDEAEALPATLAQGIRALDAAVDGRGRDHMYPDE